MEINLGNAQVNSLALSPAFELDGLGFAGTSLGLLATRDGGRTWQDAWMDGKIYMISEA